jgi:hypothetical protein
MAPAGCIWAASPPTPPANGRRSRPATSLILGERFEDTKFLIRDRGSNFTASFDADFQASGTRILRTAVQAPRMNAICERLAGTLHGELLDRVLIISEQHLRAVLTEYQSHYNTARPHQGIAQRVPDDEPDDPRLIGTDLDIQQIRRRPALNGLINEYTHAAWGTECLQAARRILFSSGTGPRAVTQEFWALRQAIQSRSLDRS